jgi:hypothetical protein
MDPARLMMVITAGVLALVIGVVSEMLVSITHVVPPGKAGHIMVVEFFVLTLIGAAVFGQKIVKYIVYLKRELSGERVSGHLLDLKLSELAKLFGSAIVSLAIYAGFSALP